jgi:hypothetical protein
LIVTVKAEIQTDPLPIPAVRCGPREILLTSPKVMRLAFSAAFAFCLLLASPARAGAPPQSDAEAAAPVIEFHSAFWVNLHHFLYLQGRIRRAQTDDASAEPEQRELASAQGMTPEQKQVWDAAVQTYANSWSSRDLLLNNQLVLINDRLTELDDCPELAGKSRRECTSGIVPELVTALDEAAPLYRQFWWPDQDRANRAWISAIAPLLGQMGDAMAARLANAYESRWPRQIRVDVVYFAGPNGAYTSVDPLHVLISSRDPRNQNLAGFETLFYEASHVISGDVEQAIGQESRRTSKPIPRDLWNAILLYTSDELLDQLTQKSYTANPALQPRPAIPNALHDRGWDRYELLLQEHWQRYLDGGIDMDTAIAHMIHDI